MHSYICQFLFFLRRAPSNGMEFLKKAEWIRKTVHDFTVNLGQTHLPADQIALLEAGDIFLWINPGSNWRMAIRQEKQKFMAKFCEEA